MNIQPSIRTKFDDRHIDIVVLGASGFIGRNITEALIKNPSFNILGISSVNADLTSYQKMLALANRIKEGSVLVVTAAVTPDRKEPIKGMLDNVNIASNLASLISLHNVAHLIYLSTVDVYGRKDLILPLDETSRIQPSSYYAISKYTSELILEKACRNRKTLFTILRLPGVYGCRDTHESPIKVFITSIIKGVPINITGDGFQLRDFLFVDDINKVVKSLVLKRISGTFNMVTGKSYTINQILDLIEEISGSRFCRFFGINNNDKVDLVFKKSAILNRLSGFKFTDLPVGLRNTYGYYKELNNS